MVDSKDFFVVLCDCATLLYMCMCMCLCMCVHVSACVQDLTFLLLEHNPSLLNKRDEADHTALWLAADAGSVPMVRLLLQYPAVTVDCFDEAGVTPLFAAARNGHLKIVEVPYVVLTFAPFCGPTCPLLCATSHAQFGGGHLCCLRLVLYQLNAALCSIGIVCNTTSPMWS